MPDDSRCQGGGLGGKPPGTKLLRNVVNQELFSPKRQKCLAPLEETQLRRD